MTERKQVVHYCAKYGKGMKYQDKKALYLYDVECCNSGGFLKNQLKKRISMNFCGKCADELEKIVIKWATD